VCVIFADCQNIARFHLR